MRYDGGDWRVAVLWYERTEDDDERLTFREPPSDSDVDFFNSTERRLVIFGGGGGGCAGAETDPAAAGENRGQRKGLVPVLSAELRGSGPAVCGFALVIPPQKKLIWQICQHQADTKNKKTQRIRVPLFKPSLARYLPRNDNRIARFSGRYQATH